jgi:serine/threonine protein kinase
MGAVYLVEDQRIFGKKYALKEMLNTLADPAERTLALRQFEQEARILATLEHPNLPRIIDYFSEHGRQYLVMEFIEGQTLEEILESQPSFLSEAMVIDWALQLCNVLDYLHAHVPPIIFRDLKPSNVMLDVNGRVKLIDFGIARVFQPGKAHDTSALGTPGYAPPEQYGKGQTDARSDIYALGATLYHLLTRYNPSQSFFNLPPIRSINPNVSEAFEQVITKALSLDPAQRWQSAKEMGLALRDLRDSKTVPPLPAIRHPAPSPPPPRSTSSTPKSPALSVFLDTNHLDFGTVLPRRVRWQPLMVSNRQAPAEVNISSDQPWLGVRPKSLRLRPGERRRVTVRVNTASLPVDSGRREKGRIKLCSEGSEATVTAEVRVESIPHVRRAAMWLANAIMGAMLGLLVIGMVGNLSLRLLGMDRLDVLWRYGPIFGAIVFALSGLRIQDTVNLMLVLVTAILICSMVGALFVAGAGFLIGLIASDRVMLLSAGAGIGLLAGAVFGIAYVCNTPGRWGIWPF